MRQLILFLIVVGFTAALHAYVWTRLVRDVALPRSFAYATAGLCILLSFGAPVAIGFSTTARRSLIHPFAIAAFSWIALLCFWVMALLIADSLRLVVWLERRVTGAPRFDAARRRFMARVIASCTLALGLGEACWGMTQALGAIPVTRRRIALRRWPRPLDGTSVVQISDLHVGPSLGRDFVERVVEQVNALRPDIVAITGDLVDGSVAELREHVAPLAGLRARVGVYFVTGNHEYYSGVDEWVVELRRLGLRVLENERVTIGNGSEAFDLAGVNDFSAPERGHDMQRALQGRDHERELILLAHQPRSALQAAAHGVGLQLSGHTHGGQIVPGNLLLTRAQPFVAGLHRLEDTWVYVNRGTGFWGPPMRVGVPPEITYLELERA